MTLQDYPKHKVIDAFIRFMANRRLNDKHSIAYVIGMLDHWKGVIYTSYLNDYKRQYLLEQLISMLNANTIDSVIKSEYVKKEVLNHIK